MFRVNPKTVTSWARTGRLQAIKTIGGHRRTGCPKCAKRSRPPTNPSDARPRSPRLTVGVVQAWTRRRSAYSAISSSSGVLLPRPEEAAQAVAFGARHDVHVHVRHRLAHDVVLRDPRALRAQAVDDRARAPLHGHEHRRQQRSRQLGQRDDVLARDHEHVPFEHRADVEERDDVGLVEHDVRGRVAGDDRAERGSRRRPRTTTRRPARPRLDGLVDRVAVQERERECGDRLRDEHADAEHDDAERRRRRSTAARGTRARCARPPARLAPQRLADAHSPVEEVNTARGRSTRGTTRPGITHSTSPMPSTSPKTTENSDPRAPALVAERRRRRRGLARD